MFTFAIGVIGTLIYVSNKEKVHQILGQLVNNICDVLGIDLKDKESKETVKDNTNG